MTMSGMLDSLRLPGQSVPASWCIPGGNIDLWTVGALVANTNYVGGVFRTRTAGAYEVVTDGTNQWIQCTTDGSTGTAGTTGVNVVLEPRQRGSCVEFSFLAKGAAGSEVLTIYPLFRTRTGVDVDDEWSDTFTLTDGPVRYPISFIVPDWSIRTTVVVKLTTNNAVASLRGFSNPRV
jgi:hypothetical protein